MRWIEVSKKKGAKDTDAPWIPYRFPVLPVSAWLGT
jgi:hypothetical protein